MGKAGGRRAAVQNACCLCLLAVRTSVVEEGSPRQDPFHAGWGEESGHPAPALGTRSRVKDDRCVTEQLQSAVTWTTLHTGVGTLLTTEVKVITWQLVLETKTSFLFFKGLAYQLV